MLLAAFCCLATGLGSNIARAQESQQVATTAATPVIVHSKFGGQILGYDIDRNGTEGLLSEYVAESDEKSLVATEAFDQATGVITKVVAEENHTLNDYITMDINGNGLGLVLF